MSGSLKSFDGSFAKNALDHREPVLFKNILCTTEGSNCWKLLDWTLNDFAEKCEDLKLPFRVGKNLRTVHPQWEVDTPIEYKTMKVFLNELKENHDPSKWFYFDYKHMKEWFKNKPDILNSFDWKKFQLDFVASDSTIWIGSKGAHTICHQDTYGCNLVAQTHGRKLWLLFPPECSDNLKSTRVPYEESTVYSKFNFFTPSENEIEAIKKMSGKGKVITLEPKDVLFIPKGWWHYVESLETSLSVNIWLPLEEDCEARLKESIVNLIINTLGYECPKVEQPEPDLIECIELVKKSLEECQKLGNFEPLQKREKLMSMSTILLYEKIFSQANQAELLPSLTLENLDGFINKNNIKESDLEVKQSDSEKFSHIKIVEAIVEALCDFSVISKISQTLTDKFIEKKA